MAAAAAGVGVGLALLPSAQRNVVIAVLLAVVGLAAAFVFVVAMIGVAYTPPPSSANPLPAWRPARVARTAAGSYLATHKSNRSTSLGPECRIHFTH